MFNRLILFLLHASRSKKLYSIVLFFHKYINPFNNSPSSTKNYNYNAIHYRYKYLQHFFPLHSPSKKRKKISLLIHYFNFQLQDTPRPHHITRRTKDPIPFPNSHCSTNTPNGTKTLQIPSKGSSASMLVNSYRSVRTPWCIKGALNILRAITIQQTDLGRYVSKVTINTILS